MDKKQALDEYRNLELKKKQALEKDDLKTFGEVSAEQQMIQSRFPDLLKPPKFH